MITARPYQEESLSLLYQYFMSNTGNPLIAYPTGTGKSLIPALFIYRAMNKWPNQRFLLITHVKELVVQNAEVVKYVWPNAPLGIYSAGLKQKESALPIVFGGIQSMIKNPSIFGHRDIIFVDEAHLVSDEESSMYLTFLATMKLINPYLKVIGLTATPFRMGMGLLTDGSLFTDIVHDLTGVEEFNRLIAEGYLSPLIPKRTKTELDVSNVGMAKNEFVASQLQAAVDKQEITYAGLREVVEEGYNRKAWLIFSSGIEHAEHIASMLGSFGIECAAVHSKQKSDYNDAAIKAFRNNQLRAIVNYSKLTTGFNHPDIDLIADFRPTMSIPLHIQKWGRGARVSNGKINCLVLDFARNVARLGHINDPVIPRKKGEKVGEVPIKICENCGTYNHMRVRFCTNCGNEFLFKNKLLPTAGTDAILRSDLPQIETFAVTRVLYAPHDKTGSPQSLKVTYFCGMQMFREFVCLEHPGYAKHIAHQWWKQRHKTEPPASIKEALSIQSQLKVPRRIRVWVNKKFQEIVGVEF